MTQLAESQAHVEPIETAATTPQRPWLPAVLAATSGVVVIGFLMLLWFGIQQREKGTVSEVSAPLRTAPDFQSGLFDGGTFRLADELGQGRPVLLNFWASWCGPCIEEAPVLEAGPVAGGSAYPPSRPG